MTIFSGLVGVAAKICAHKLLKVGVEGARQLNKCLDVVATSEILEVVAAGIWRRDQ
jgi:hypothetical protein